MVITTERLVLRPWQESDAADLFEYAKDPAVGPAAGWAPHASVDDSREVIRTVLSAAETYAICLRSTGKPIGSIGLAATTATYEDVAPDALEVGYWVGAPHWGQGYAPEAVRAIQRHAFADLDCSELWCAYYDGNVKSRRVQEKCGFTYHHVEKDVDCLLLGEVRTEHFTYLSRRDWAAE